MATKPKGKFRSVRKHEHDDMESAAVTNADATSSEEKHNSNALNTSNKSQIASTPTVTRDYLRINGPLSHQRNPSQSVMVRLKRLDTLRLNQRIKVKDYGFGTIQFLGCVHFAQGLFVGVELDEAHGKHDGSYHGQRYFTAKDKHGVLVKQHRVELLDVEINNMSNNMGLNLNDDDFMNHIFDDFMDTNNKSNTPKLGLSNKSSVTSIGGYENNSNMIINELKIQNKTLDSKVKQYMSSVDGLQLKLIETEKENMQLKEEKLNFENEMTRKIEKMEQELKQIRVQLNTKDQVLRKQMGKHEQTKIRFRKKIKQHEALKQKNQDTVQLILYGDNLKDEIINEYKKKDKKYKEEKQDYLLEMERINIAAHEKLNQSVEQWIFEYTDGGHLIQ